MNSSWLTRSRILTVGLSLGLSPLAPGATEAPAGPWIPDLGDGTYKNPVLFADYSDPDAVRVGDDFYLVSSSFPCAPGLPLLHSKDLGNWTIINHVITTVQLPGGRVWLDSTAQGAPYQYLSAPIRDQKALLVPSAGASASTLAPTRPRSSGRSARPAGRAATIWSSRAG